MARGRQQKWICLDCGAAFAVQGIAPKMCCACGSARLGRAPSLELAENFAEKRLELEQVCHELNDAYGRYASLKARYDEIMAYWKQQKRRGYITPEEYQQLAEEFIGARPVKIRRTKQMAKIPENVLNVLGECIADGNLLYLPSIQLDRKTYTEVNKVLENMGGKWNRKAKAHVFAEDDDVAEMLENVLLTQEVKDLKCEYQFFPTPRAVAERMCEMAEIDSASEVLEPSCGNGQLADVIWEHLPAGMCCIELNTDMKRYLAEKPYGVNYRDFLDVTKKEIGSINRVVMNPPFTRHQDIDHVRHAYDLLDAGGILVAIMCESTFFRTDKKSVEFRDFLDSVYAQAIKLEPGAFHESGTDVVTRIVKIRKPP